ncbi:Bro-N domain-containing protein [Candidatus Amesbacteria bacterium]|nr:Bro-N domain-containing protein [Candidatus Amesbacteria bacterium]
METTKIALFKGKKIRKTLYKNEWWFSIVDVITVLTDSPQAKTYWAKRKDRDKEMAQPFPFWEQLKLPAEDEKMRDTDCADTEGIFRIIQSIPSSKAEPFKRWLAKVGYERVQEIENPELATKRTRMLYKLKGYSEDWIEKRMRGITIREELTDEWQRRGAKIQKDYEILTAEISKATFGVTPNQYKKLKGLKRENLRDHMDDKEQLEKEIGRSVVSKKNFLPTKK